MCDGAALEEARRERDEARENLEGWKHGAFTVSRAHTQLEAERDRLRAALEEIASIDPTGVPELRLPIELASAALSNPTAAPPDIEAIEAEEPGEWYVNKRVLAEVEAERDRLRARLDVVNALAGSPPPGQAAWTHENLLEILAERVRLRAAFDHTARLVHGLHGGPRFEDCGERFCVKNRAVLSLSNPTAITPEEPDA